MKTKLKTILLLVLIFTVRSNAQFFPTLGGQRAGISTLQFLKMGVGGRATAMSDAFIAVADDASALYWNPAGLAFAKQNEVMFSHNSWVADISQEFVGGFYKLSESDVIGLSLTSLHMENMEVTDEFNPFGNGQYFGFGDISFAFSYSRKMTDQFSIGLSVRYVEETLDRLKMRGVLIDIGTMYWTGLGSTRFAVAVTNFGNEFAPDGEVTLWGGRTNSKWQAFSPPTMFRIGFAFEPLQTVKNRITTSIQLNHPNDNSENISIGAEYDYAKIVSLRAGYKINVDEQGLTAGAGVNLPLGIGNVSVDYGYSAFSRLGSIHRFSVDVGFPENMLRDSENLELAKTELNDLEVSKKKLLVEKAELVTDLNSLNSLNVEKKIKTEQDAIWALIGCNEDEFLQFDKEVETVIGNASSQNLPKDTVQNQFDLLRKNKISAHPKYFSRVNNDIKNLLDSWVVEDSIKYYSVVERDNLWKISASNNGYNNPLLWMKIFEANRNSIDNPNKIYVNDKLIIPSISSDELEKYNILYNKWKENEIKRKVEK